MLNILHDAQEIETQVATLLSFVQAGESRSNRDIGFKGGYITVPTFYHAESDLWIAYERQPKGHNGTKVAKHWFGYGLGDPNDKKSMSPICEINIPIGRSTAWVAGALAKDSSGDVFLVHTGKFGGGKPGVGQKTFWQYYSDDDPKDFALYTGNQQPKQMVLIGNVASPEIMSFIADLVTTVQAFKQDVAAGIIAPVPGDNNVDEDDDSPDVAQEKTISNHIGTHGLNDSDANESENATGWQRSSGTVNPTRYHARVRNTLTHILKTKGYFARRDMQKDILIRNTKNELSVLFEVKSGCDTQSLYTAVGQLLINSEKETHKKVLVIPSPGDSRIVEAAKAYEIDTLFFEWEAEDKKQPVFPDLDVLIGGFPKDLQASSEVKQ
ncbi:MAG: hypothetical protein LBV80_00335 [Deltaproteobacteria bacterium]|jgi:hypothetical protein|nr:hypothetical protein [Deltaproteobacteria bacterium]